jgi:hypothetical protein
MIDDLSCIFLDRGKLITEGKAKLIEKKMTERGLARKQVSSVVHDRE